MKGIYLLLTVSLLQACCYFKSDAPTPKIESPAGYDKIKHTELKDYVGNRIYASICDYVPDHTIGNGFTLISNSNNSFDKDCWNKEIPQVDWDNFDVIRCSLGGASNTVYADMAYAIFISHKNKEVLIKSNVTKSGSCGSDNESYTWLKVFKIPKIPAGYKVRVKIIGGG